MAAKKLKQIDPTHLLYTHQLIVYRIFRNFTKNQGTAREALDACRGAVSRSHLNRVLRDGAAAGHFKASAERVSTGGHPATVHTLTRAGEAAISRHVKALNALFKG